MPGRARTVAIKYVEGVNHHFVENLVSGKLKWVRKTKEKDAGMYARVRTCQSYLRKEQPGEAQRNSDILKLV